MDFIQATWILAILLVIAIVVHTVIEFLVIKKRAERRDALASTTSEIRQQTHRLEAARQRRQAYAAALAQPDGSEEPAHLIAEDILEEARGNMPK